MKIPQILLVLLIILFSLLIIAPGSAFPNERYWSELFCQDQLGTAESYVLGRKRIDCETDDIAWEVEWADKLYQGIGQAQIYSWGSNKAPGLVLLVRKPSDYHHALLAVRFIAEAMPDMHLKVIAPHHAWGDCRWNESL